MVRIRDIVWLVVCFVVTVPAFAQKRGRLVGLDGQMTYLDFQSRKIPKDIRKYVQDLTRIPSGTFYSGVTGEYGADITRRQVTVDEFYISQIEVPNWMYRDFCNEVRQSDGEEAYAKVYPDTACWLIVDNSHMTAMSKSYFTHPAYDNYPVVGVSYSQAVEFCVWLTEKVKNKIKNAGKTPDWVERINFRIPNELEWEYAARGGRYGNFPWGDAFYTRNKKGMLEVHANSGALRDTNNTLVYSAELDGALFTSDVHSYDQNDFGLYNMSGNVSEWTSDQFEIVAFSSYQDINFEYPPSSNASVNNPDSIRRVVKGGSYADFPYFLQPGTRVSVLSNKQSSSIGFRIALTVFPITEE